jgi:hypothetical protein
MTTTFKINNLDRDTADGFVTVAHWTASQESDDFSVSINNTQAFTKVDGVNLIPYAELTEALVIGWVKTALGADTVAAIDAALTAQTADYQAPKKASGTPWAV